MRSEVGSLVEVGEDDGDRRGEVRSEGICHEVCNSRQGANGVSSMLFSDKRRNPPLCDARDLCAYATSYKTTMAFGGSSSRLARLVLAIEDAACSVSISRLVNTYKTGSRAVLRG